MQWTVRLEARTSAGEVKTTELVTRSVKNLGRYAASWMVLLQTLAVGRGSAANGTSARLRQ